MPLLIIIICLLSLNVYGRNVALTEKVFTIEESFLYDNQARTYRIHLPPNYYQNQETFPLVLAFHGGGGNGKNFEKLSELSETADAQQFIVVYPDGLKSAGLLRLRTWNAGKCCGKNAITNVDDVGFINLLINQLAQKYRINTKKVYATGHSNGAMLAYRLACELPNKIAAIATNAGTIQITPCNPSRVVPIIHFHSTLDNNVPYQGGVGLVSIARQYNPSVDNTLNIFATLAHCEKNKQIVISTASYTFYKWSGCENNVELHYYLTNDGGHAWAGGHRGLGMDSDRPSTAIVANELLWRFFRHYQLP